MGIVAARLVDNFERPAIVLSCENGVAKGSARSVGNVNIYDLIKENESYLNKFGGHKMAAGLGLHVEDIEAFKIAINKSANKLNRDDFIPIEDVIGVMPSDEIDHELLNLLDNFEPYGEANNRPLFLVKDAQILEIKLFGKEKNHSKIIVRQFSHERKPIELILFKKVYEMPEDRTLTCSYRVTKNEFNNKISAQLIINKLY